MMQPRVVLIVSAIVAAILSAAVSSLVTFAMMMRSVHQAGITDRLQLRALDIVDSAGKPRITLSSTGEVPIVKMLDASEQSRLNLSLDAKGYGSVRLVNPNGSNPVAALEIDDKGAHVKFDRPGGASSYLFLNNSGESGVVMIDAQGARSLDVLVTASGKTQIRRYDQSADISH